DVPAAERGAQFVCVAALVLPSGTEHVAEGAVRGRLTGSPRGTNGFGYDPIFVPDGYELTTAEVSAEGKDKISHRGRALRALAPVIAASLAGQRLPGGRRRTKAPVGNGATRLGGGIVTVTGWLIAVVSTRDVILPFDPISSVITRRVWCWASSQMWNLTVRSPSALICGCRWPRRLGGSCLSPSAAG